MVYIPGCPSLTDVEKYGGPNPYPGNISEFDAAILRYDTHVKEPSHLARNQERLYRQEGSCPNCAARKIKDATLRFEERAACA